MFTMNVQSTGQSHATIFPRMVAERLGIKAEQVGHAPRRFSAHEIAGYASVGSRTAMTAGHAMVKTLEAMLAKGKKVAADGARSRRRRHRIQERRLQRGRHRPPHVAVRRGGARQGDEEEGRDRRKTSTPRSVTETPLTFPNGCHIAEVEIDPQTGLLDARVLFGDGRQRQHPRPHHRRGPGARLGRHGRRPGDAGADRVRRRRPARQRARSWTTPCRARTTCRCSRTSVHEVPATTNPLGVKGAGEAGTTAAIAAVMNAFADAIPGQRATRSRCRRRRRRCGGRARRWRARTPSRSTERLFGAHSRNSWPGLSRPSTFLDQ